MGLKDSAGGESLMSAIFSNNPLNDLVGKISEPLNDIVSSTMKNNHYLYDQDGFKQVAGWMQEQASSAAVAISDSSNPLPIINNNTTNNNMDSFFSSLSNKIVENLMQHVPNYFGQLMLDNVRIKTQGKQKSIKSDLSFTMDPIKPYVEFVKKINGIETLKIKSLFQIDSDIKMSNVGFLSDDVDQRRILHLGILTAHLKISLLEFGVYGTALIREPKTLLEREFGRDLSEIKLSV